MMQCINHSADSQRVDEWAAAGMAAQSDSMRAELNRGALPPCCDPACVTADGFLVADRTRICGDCPLAQNFADAAFVSVRLNHKDQLYGYLVVAIEASQPFDEEERDLLNEVTTNAQRSATLTRQLLAFARRQSVAPKALPPPAAVGGTETILLVEDETAILKLAETGDHGGVIRQGAVHAGCKLTGAARNKDLVQVVECPLCPKPRTDVKAFRAHLCFDTSSCGSAARRPPGWVADHITQCLTFLWRGESLPVAGSDEPLRTKRNRIEDNSSPRFWDYDN